MDQEGNLNERLANGFASLVESAESKLRRQQQQRLKPIQVTDTNRTDPLISPAFYGQDQRCTVSEMEATQTPRRKLPKVAGWQLKCPAFSTVQLEDEELDNQADRAANNAAPNECCVTEFESFQGEVGGVLERRRATQPAVGGGDPIHWSAASCNSKQSLRRASQRTGADENGFTLGEAAGLRRLSDCGGARFLGRPKEMTNRVFGDTKQRAAASEQMNTNDGAPDKTPGNIRPSERPRDKDKNDCRPQLSSESWASASLGASRLAPSGQSARSSSGDHADDRGGHSKSMFADNNNNNNMRQAPPPAANEQRQLIESHDGVRPPRSIVSCPTASRSAYRLQSEHRLEPEPGHASERDDGPTPTNDPDRAPASRNNCNKSGDTAAWRARRASVAATTKCERQRNQQQSDSSHRFCNSFKVSSSSSSSSSSPPANGGAGAADKGTSGLQPEQRKRLSEDVGAQVKRQSEISSGERRHSANVFDLGLAKRLMNKCHINQPSAAPGRPSADNRRANLRVAAPAGSGLRETGVGGELASNMNGGASVSSLAPYRLAARAIETMQAAAERVAAPGQQQKQRHTNDAPPEWQRSPGGQRRHSTYMLPLLLLTKRQDTYESEDEDEEDDNGDDDDDERAGADFERENAPEGEPRIRIRRQTANEQTLGGKAKLICNLRNSASSPSALSTPTNADSAGGCGGPCCSRQAQLERLAHENTQLAAINKQAESRRIEANGSSWQSWQRQQSNTKQRPQQQQVILRHRIGSNPLERVNVARANNGQANSQQQRQQLIGQRPHQNGLKAADEPRSGSFGKARRSLEANRATKTKSSNISQEQQVIGSERRRLSMGVTGSVPLRPPRDHPQLIETQQSGHEPVYEPLIPESGFKIVVMGTSGSGKTAIIQRFLYGTFSARHLPTVEDTYFIEFPYRKQLINIAVSDTSGTYQFPAMKKLAINSGDAFILVYSVDEPQSFDDLEQLRQTILEEREQAYLDSIDASAGGHKNNDHHHHHHHHHHHAQAATNSSTSSSASSAASSSWALSGPGGGCGATVPSSQTSTDGAHLQHNQLYPLSSSIGTNQSSQQQQLCAATEPAHQGADVSPSRHWSLAALFSNHHHQQNHNQSSNSNGSSAAMHTANQILHQQLFSSAANTTAQSNSNSQPLNGAVRTASSLNSSLCSSTTSASASASTSCSSSADNSRRSSISAAEAALRTRRTRRPPMVIVANKHDLPRDRHQVNSDEMEALVVIDWNNGFVRASAALNWNIDEIFQQVLKQARQPPTLTEAIVSKRRKSLPPKLPHP